MADTFIFRGEWIDHLSKLKPEEVDKILADIVRYGTKRPTLYDEDPVIASFVNMVKGSIDISVMNYESKVEASKGAGRRKKINDEEVYQLARVGKSSTEIAELLGCSKSSIDKNEGWRNRKKDDFVF
jgi:hypothetical protein